MSDRADQLREALAHWDRFGPARGPSRPGTPLSEMVKLIDAARSYLDILEPSDELVGKVAKAIRDRAGGYWLLDSWAIARAALAALSDKEEEL